HPRVDVGQVAPSVSARQAVGVEVGEQRLDVQTLGRRELGTDDERPVLAASGLGACWEDRGTGAGTRGYPDVQYSAVAARELILDDDIGEVQLDVRRERRDARDTGKVAVRV